MNATNGTVVPISAIPFGVVPLPAAESLNAALLGLFNARARAQGEALLSSHRYSSQDDLFLWPEPATRQLAEEMSRGVCSVVLAVNGFGAEALNTFSIEARAWFTILEQDGYVPAANYPLTAWCAVYCVAAPEVSATRADSGVLRIYESRLATMFHDVTTASMNVPYRPGHYGWRPVPGQMAVFPAAATHEIALLRSPGQLILVTARFRFLAPDQSSIGRW
jgi:hypothetical protein